MASGLLSAELAATCNSLGFYDGNKYHLEPHSKETIRDIIRYLRRDDDSRVIRRFLGNSKILKTDLLPIIQSHSKEKDLFDVVLRLIVNLTTPALIIYNDVVPTDKNELNQYLQIVSHLQSYKEAFSDHKSWAVVSEELSRLLNKETEARDEDEQKTIERILILVRNVLHTPSDALAEGRPDNDASLHDQVVWALHQSSMLDLLLYMASSVQEATFYMHLLEIICLMVREQPPSLLAQTAAQRSVDEKQRDEEELLKLRQKEQQARQLKTRQYHGSRHSNFGGTFVIKNMKSISDKELIYHKPLQKVNHFSLDYNKQKVKIPKNRQPLKCANTERKSALSVRLILKQFCVEILNAAYNPLMRHIKDALNRGKTQDNDESYYFIAMKFFMEFNRNYKFQVKLVSETMSVETFYFVQKNLETWHEMMITDKKRVALWSARMHLALKAYKELLQNLIAMDSSPEEAVRESSKVIKSNIFYVVEYRELLLVLINTFKKSKYSHQYLIDLIETTHIFLKLLEKFCQNKKMVVQKTTKKKRKAKPKRKEKTKEQIFAAEELWPQVESSLSNVMSSPVTKEVIPFDAASEKPMEEQKVDAMKRIQVMMKSGDIEEAVALFRASREVWPENHCFGDASMSQEEEISCLKEVFLAELDTTDAALQLTREPVHSEVDEEEEEEVYPTLEEKTFDIMDLIKRFASSKVLGVCITLLSTLEKNSAFTNHCVAKMLHRIAWDCKLPSLLFQASLFRKFQFILESKDPAYKELAGLALYIIRKFVKIAETNKKVFMELLFFKNAKDAYEIECGYGSFQKTSAPAKSHWEEHEEDELRRLHEEYLKIMPQEDMVDWITEQLIAERSKRIVQKKMKELGLTLLKKNKKGLLTSWTEEQEEELKEIYLKIKETSEGTEDIVGLIMKELNIPRSRQNIASALVKLGFAESTKEFKKPSRKSKGKDKPANESSGSESESSEDEDEGDPVQESREQVRAKEKTPDLFSTIQMLFSEKAANPYIVEGLKWLASCMQDCLEDLEDEPEEVPLLPLSSESLLSVENQQFKLFLSSLGIFKPLQQEIYWRFPAEWRKDDFVSRMDLIDLLIAHENVEDIVDEVKLNVKKITGKDVAELKEEDVAEDTPSVTSSPVSVKKAKTASSKEKKKELKEKLFGKVSEARKKKKNKDLLTENIEELNTEDFNVAIQEECRDLLRKEGFVKSPATKSSKKSFKRFESDSDSDSQVDRSRELGEAGRSSSPESSPHRRMSSSDSEKENISIVTEKKKTKTVRRTKAFLSDTDEEESEAIKSSNIESNGVTERVSPVHQTTDPSELVEVDKTTQDEPKTKVLLDKVMSQMNVVPRLSRPDLSPEKSEGRRASLTKAVPKLTRPLSSDEDDEVNISNTKRPRLPESDSDTEVRSKPSKKKFIIDSDDE